MICLYCKGATKVTNSRPTKDPVGVWRRRQCLECAAVYTTREQPDFRKSLMLATSEGDLEPLDRDVVLMTVYECCRHRKDALEAAQSLSGRIIAQLIAQKPQQGIFTKEIVDLTAYRILSHFDTFAGQHYKAYIMSPAK